MVRSIFITAIRNLLRYRVFSLINLFGLTVSMSLALLIILIIHGQYSFDNFHEDEDRIYRINTEAVRVNGSAELYASTPIPLGDAISTDYSLIEHSVTLISGLNDELRQGNLTIPLSGLYTEPAFFKIFNFRLANGNEDNALAAPYSIVITKEAAIKLFGRPDAVNEVIHLERLGNFTVTGVLESVPGNTHLQFESLVSLSTVDDLKKNSVLPANFNAWTNYYSAYTYIKILPDKSIAELEKTLAAISGTHYANLKLETRDKAYNFYPQSLGHITPGPILSNQLGSGMPTLLLVFLGILAVIILFMACFNYSHLTIAKSLSRAREIGIRKVIGARRWQVFLQFIGEAITMSLVALLLSYLVLQLLKPALESLHISQEFTIDLREGLVVYLLFLLFAVLIGIFSGLLPAAYLSTFNPASALKGGTSDTKRGKPVLRKALVVVQFTLSLIFIVFILIVNGQMNYMFTTNYGFNDKNIVNVPLSSVDFTKFSDEVSSLSGVAGVSGISHSLGTWADRSSDYKRNPGDEPFGMRDFIVDAKYLSNLEIPFVAGENFRNEGNGQERFVILNEQALAAFNFIDAHSAIGETIYVQDTLMLQVVGVVKDFHFRPLNYAIGPVAFRKNENMLQIANVKINEQADVNEVMAGVAAIWQKHDPLHPIEWQTMEAEIDNAYDTSGMTDVVKIVGYFSFIAVSIACIGLLGMVVYSVQLRLKEIGMRKVLGASPVQLITLLNRSFLLLFLLATLIGGPLGYLIGTLFINNYAYKIDIGLPVVFAGAAFLFVLGFITISTQTVRAAMANPVRWLRNE